MITAKCEHFERIRSIFNIAPARQKPSHSGRFPAHVYIIHRPEMGFWRVFPRFLFPVLLRSPYSLSILRGRSNNSARDRISSRGSENPGKTRRRDKEDSWGWVVGWVKGLQITQVVDDGRIEIQEGGWAKPTLRYMRISLRKPEMVSFCCVCVIIR